MKSSHKDEPLRSGNVTTIIGSGTHLTGSISCQNDLRIDGRLTGDIHCMAKVVIGAEGVVEGDLHGANADVTGKVIGDIHVSESLVLRGKAFVKGDIHTASLQMEPQVTFNGSCHMGANVVGINEGHAMAVAQGQ